MKRYMDFRGLVLGICALALCGGIRVQAQDINGTQQLENRGFEYFDNEEDNGDKGSIEPVGWNSFMTGNAASSILEVGKSRRLEKITNDKRPGSTGSACVKLFSTTVIGVNANGMMSTGRVNLGSTSAADASNHVFTDRSAEGFHKDFTSVPDSLVVWVKYAPDKASSQGQVRAIIHDDYEMWDPWTTGMLNHAVAIATVNPVKGDGGWVRYSAPFDKSGCSSNDPLYILVTSSTNSAAGGDPAEIYLDDILFVYNPKIQIGVLPQLSFNMRDKTTGKKFVLPYTLTGTILPDANSPETNEVIAELSNAEGLFTSPVEIGRVTSETGGSMEVTVPGDMPLGKHYRIRLRTTNRPLVSEDNGTDIILMEGYSVEVEKNGDYGTVSGAGAFELNSWATVRAVANVGYHFVRWEENGQAVDNAGAEYSFQVKGDRRLQAVFEMNRYTLSVKTEGNGTVTLDPLADEDGYGHGQTVKISAEAAEGSVLNGYYRGGSLLSQTSPYSLVMTGNDEITVKFEAGKVRIIASSNNSTLGSVSGGGLYEPGARATLTATAASRFCYFVAWVETVEGRTDTVSRNSTISFEVESTRSLTALFAEIFYTVSLSCSPAEAAIVTGGGTFSAAKGDLTVSLRAQANGGYEFMYWQEDAGGEEIYENPYYLVENGRLSGNASFTAYFKELSYRVSLSLEDELSGTIAEGGSGDYKYGSSATVKVLPAEGYDFIGWYEGDERLSAQNPYTFEVERPLSLRARLERRSYPVTLKVEPELWGTVNPDSAYKHGDTAALEAHPAGGYVFSHWAVKRGLDFVRESGENPWKVAVTSPLEYYAVFIPRPKKVRVASIPEGVGSFSGEGEYQAGEIAVLRAYDVHGYHFGRWVNADTSTAYLNSTLRLTVANDTVLRALYLPNSFNLLVMTEGAQSYGLIGIDTSEAAVMSKLEVSYDQNLLLKAKPVKEGYAFWQWRVVYTDEAGNEHDEFYSKSDSVIYRVDGAATLVAYFVPNAFRIKAGVMLESHWGDTDVLSARHLAVSSDTMGRVEGEGNYRENNWVELDAVPEPGYAFSRWMTASGEEFLRTRSKLLLEITQDTFVFALFKPDTVIVESSSSSHPAWGSISSSGTYAYGDTVTLRAVPSFGYEFAGWYRIPEVSREAVSGYAAVSGRSAVSGRAAGSETGADNSGIFLSGDTVYTFTAEASFRVEGRFVPQKYQMTLYSEPEGAGTLTGAGRFDYMEETFLSAEAEKGYEFKAWRMKNAEGVWEERPFRAFPVKMVCDSTATAVFAPIPLKWEARVENPAMGRVMEVASGQGSLGQTVVFTATPNPYYRFTAWVDTAGYMVSNQARLEVVLSRDTLLYAVFAPQTVRLTANSADNRGYVEAFTGRTSYGGILSLQATANRGYRFDRWTGASDTTKVISGSSFLQVVMDRDSSLLAHFVPEEYDIAVEVEPSYAGKAEIKIGGENMGEQTLAGYGSEIELVAEASPHYVFSAWRQGLVTLDGGERTVEDDAVYTAVFVLKSYSLSLQVEPEGYGSVTGGGAFKFGETASIEAVPGSQYVFVGWRNGDVWLSDVAALDVFLEEDMVLTAVFDIDSVEVDIESSWGGTATGSGRYRSGASARIEALPYAGHEFVAWRNREGEVVSGQNPYTFVIGSDVSFVAEFKGSSLQIEVDAGEGGYVSGGGTVAYGQTVGLLAVPDSGYVFSGWTSTDMELDERQAANPYLTFDAGEAASFRANFTPDKYNIYTETSPKGVGTVSPGGSFPYGAELSFGAFPDNDHVFVGWTLNGKYVETEPVINITVSGSERYIAVFEPKRVKIAVEAYPSAGGLSLGTGTYFYGDTVRVGVQPYSGYELVSWTDADFNTIGAEEFFERVLGTPDLFTASLRYVGIPDDTIPQSGTGDTIRDTILVPVAPEPVHFRLWPNPVRGAGELHVEMEASDLLYVRLYNMSGAVVYYRKISEQGVRSASVRMPAHLGGTYVYELGLTGGVVRRGRLVVL